MAPLPRLTEWRNWATSDYINYFLSKNAARTRLAGAASPSDVLPEDALGEFCHTIFELNTELYNSNNPDISIIIRAWNEERELLPTLMSYAMADLPNGSAELIVVDNNSSDGTAEIARLCGVKCVSCIQQGIGHATKAGYEAVSPTSRYIFISDADVRLTRPFSDMNDFQKSTVLRTSFDYLERSPNVMGVSTGAVVEAAHWTYHFIRQLRRPGKQNNSIGYWSGANQFIRRYALDAIGGINEKIEYGSGEDHYRQYELARFCKPLKYDLHCGRLVPQIIDPTYYSGRRFATFRLTASHFITTLRSKSRRKDADGMPVYEEHNPITKIHIRQQ